jgi:Amt family ammonium transporter
MFSRCQKEVVDGLLPRLAGNEQRAEFHSAWQVFLRRLKVFTMHSGLKAALLASVLLLTLTAVSQAADTPATTTVTTTTVSPGATAAPAAAPDPRVTPVGFDRANSAWMLVCAALVLMMTAPGLAMFYGGLVRKKNILGVMMQCVFLMGLMSLVWAFWGYSLAFGGDLAGGFVGNGDYLFLKGVLPTWDAEKNVSVVPMAGTIPRMLHMVYQMMFFIITPGLICGAFAERMKFSAMVLLSVLWGTFVYCPLAHWVWSDTGWLNSLNVKAAYPAFDFAGGTVVHISSGISALVAALLLGRRLGYGHEAMPPHNLTYTCIGTGLLWVGWFGFNAGSAGESNIQAVNAFVATHMAAAAGVLAWAGAEWIQRGKPSILGACSGAVAGLVCITPACGFVSPMSGIFFGLAGGLVCYYACNIKGKLGYDDSLDAFGVHGVGGVLGALMTGIFSTRAVIPGATTAQGVLEGNWTQFRNQGIGVIVALVLAVIGTVVILKVLDLLIGLRVSQQEELQGLDVSQHGEEGYIFL